MISLFLREVTNVHYLPEGSTKLKSSELNLSWFAVSCEKIFLTFFTIKRVILSLTCQNFQKANLIFIQIHSFYLRTILHPEGVGGGGGVSKFLKEMFHFLTKKDTLNSKLFLHFQ